MRLSRRVSLETVVNPVKLAPQHDQAYHRKQNQRGGKDAHNENDAHGILLSNGPDGPFSGSVAAHQLKLW
jgi:hypothetical protein